MNTLKPHLLHAFGAWLTRQGRFFLRGAVVITAGGASAGERLECISPDGKFAVHRKDNADGSETESEIVSLPGLTKVQKLPPMARGVVLWAPDSKAFAYEWEEAPRVTYVFIARADGDVFNRTDALETFPGVELVNGGWPKGWKSIGGGRSYVAPRRWLSADTLEVRGTGYEKVIQKEDELQEMWAVRVNFTAKLSSKPGEPKLSEPMVVYKGFDKSEDTPEPPKEIAAAVQDARTWKFSPDNSAVLVSTGPTGVKLLALKGESKGKVTELEEEVKKLFAADFKASHPAAKEGELPFKVVDLAGFDADWGFQGKDEIVIQCEASTNDDGERYQGMWCARLDAVWSISAKKFLKQKVAHGVVEK